MVMETEHFLSAAKIILAIFVGLPILYAVVRLVSKAVFKSYFESRREHAVGYNQHNKRKVPTDG